MIKKSPEEYFGQQSFGAGGGGDFTPAERAFMQKYLGLDEADILRKIGITPPAPAVEQPVAAQPAPVPPAAPEAEPTVFVNMPEAGPVAMPVTMPDAMPVALEAEDSASVSMPEAEPEAAPAEPEIPAQPEAVSATEPAPAAPIVSVAPDSPLIPTPGAAPIPDPAPAPAESVPVTQPVSAPTAEAPAEQVFEPEEPPLESIMRKAEDLQLVAFYLGEQEFVLPIIAVQEVIKAVPHTRLPSAPSIIAGVINLRDRVTPLLQLRELLSVPRTGRQDDGFIIICRRGGIQMGLIIDRVHTMYRVLQKDVDWAVESHLGNVEVVCGLLKENDRLLGIISVDKIFSMLVEA